MRLSSNSRKLLYLGGLPSVVACLAVWVAYLLNQHVGPLNVLDIWERQLVGNIRRVPNASQDVVTIVFDENTPKALGLGPDVTSVPRRIHAELLRRLDAAGAKVALVDVMFVASKPGDDGFKSVLNGLRRLRVTLGNSLNEPAGKNMDFSTPIARGEFYPNAICSTYDARQVRMGSLFGDQVAASSELFGAHPIQFDLVTKKQVLYAPISAVLQFFDIPVSRLNFIPKAKTLTADTLEWRLDSNDAIDVRWTKSATPFKRWRYEDAFAALQDPSQRYAFRDKLVVIGYGGTQDMHESGMGRIHGVDFIAQMVNTALLARSSQFDEIPDMLGFGYCFAVGFAAFSAMRARKVWVEVAVFFALVGLCLGIQRIAALVIDISFPIQQPILTIVLCTILGVLLGRYWTDKVDLTAPVGAHEATILFLDIKGSTRLLNDIGRERYEELLRALFREYSAIVARCGGQIERTLGDGFIATFRPKGDRHHALRAAESAKLLASATKSVSESLGIKVGVAIGFESGIVSGGYVIENGNRVWSSSGATVHLAQRLQAQCGPLNLTVAVGPAARRMIVDSLPCVTVAKAEMKGFEEEVEVATFTDSVT